MTFTLKSFFLTASMTLLFSSSSRADSWTRFRGPNGSGVGDAKTVPHRWSEKEFNWRIPLPGTGHSSPVLWNKKIFITSADEKQGTRFVSCIHADNGRILWTKTFVGRVIRHHSLNSVAASTPCVDAERVYLCWANSAEYIVQALDHTGNDVWKVDLGPFKSGHGAGVSPILHEGALFIAREHGGDSQIVSLNAKTGRLRWKIPRNTKATYTTPCIYAPKGRRAELIVTNWRHGITALDPANGKTNWELSVFDQRHSETAIGSPIVYKDLVLGTCGYLGYGMQTVAVQPGEQGKAKARQVYGIDRGAPLTTTPIAVDGLLFLWADEGIVTCANARTGKLHWRKRVGGKFYASPVAVNGAIYCASTDGRMIVLKASPMYELIARNPLGETSHSTPAIAHGRMYVRTHRHLISIGGK